MQKHDPVPVLLNLKSDLITVKARIKKNIVEDVEKPLFSAVSALLY
jgi:hypothetical protein